MISLDELVALIERHRYTVTCESELHEALARVFTTAALSFASEVRLSPRDRPDFMVGPMAIEAKVQGYRGAVLTQVWRYLEHPQVESLVLVTTLRRHSLPSELRGKPIRVALARGL